MNKEFTEQNFINKAQYGDIDSKDRDILLELIFNEQMRMIKKDNKKYDSNRYKRLEVLKVIIKDWSI